MQTSLDCIPCFMRQALKAGRLATTDERLQKELLDAVAAMVPGISPEMTPPEIGDGIYRDVSRLTGVEDPFRELKDANMREAFDLMPEVLEAVSNAADPLMTAVRVAIAGNVIDHGVGRSFSVRDAVDQVLHQTFAILDEHSFRTRLEEAPFVLYVGDNAGESVFDTLLIRELQKPVVFAVRDVAVINDVTRQDAVASGIGDVARIVSTGSSAPGAVLDRCSGEFLDLFDRAELVISKGQGNYEALSGTSDKVFFLLRAKCPVIADHLGVDVDDIVLKQG
ncbi:DUF89 family protein [Prosthecochloris sp. N3]|uniref:DUF89 family protein n=1 Tax=Prosthecochloris ethylica TaxID=2743976 RepID=A0ABR9XRX0_9CHLB|nr:ARMT1-like domain-containing protein [Prosthecochloris ethylica]MBF0586768.1 DUF89 family protein [Prosthecochloris ethylica]MBF0636674.1 DUF89 family protein [Prosthecochloris ethylica]NUK47927.1 DUF89 family protein [Prosthecochloris ethylica]